MEGCCGIGRSEGHGVCADKLGHGSYCGECHLCLLCGGYVVAPRNPAGSRTPAEAREILKAQRMS